MEQKTLENLCRISLWSEIKYFYHNLKFSPFGSSTIEVPHFFRESLKNIAENLDDIGFQYDITYTELKKSIVANFPVKNILDREIFSDELIVAPGAVKAIQFILNSLLDFENDEVIIIQPAYICHITDLLSRKFKNLKIINRKENDLTLDFDELEKNISEKTKFILITNPDNPTTDILNEEGLEKLTLLLDKYPRILVIEDLAYFAYLGRNKKLKSFSAYGNNKNKTFSVFSGGKLFNVTGVRCGWAICPADLVSRVYKNSLITFTYVSPVETLSIAESLRRALEPYKGCINFYEWIKKDQNERFDYVINFLKDFAIKVIQPQGTYYLIIDVSNYRDKLPQKYFFTCGEKEYKKNLDMAFCRMLADKQIGLLPLSSLIEENDELDYLIRISCNRDFKDLDFLKNALHELKKENIIN